MTEATTINTDLDLLAERVEKAAALIQSMREDRQRLETERDDLSRKLKASDQKLQGQDAATLLAEVQTLRKEQREWQGERRDVVTRIETLVRKLERLEG